MMTNTDTNFSSRTTRATSARSFNFTRGLSTTALLVLVAFISFITFTAGTARAADYTWDTATGDSAITDGGGTWQVGVGNWYDGTVYDQNWADGNTAIFGTGTEIGRAHV